MGTDQNGDEPGKGMVSGGDTVLWKSGICAGKDTGVNSPVGRKGTFDGRYGCRKCFCVTFDKSNKTAVSGESFLNIAMSGVNKIMCHIWHSNREEVRKFMMKRTISGMIGTGSLAHNRRDFVAENVNRERVHLNIKYCDENLKTVYHELFDQAVERYNEGKRNDRKITDYYEKIRQGKQEKLFHEVIFQIGNREDMAVGTSEGNLAVKVLDEYVKDFKKRNPTLRVFSCYLHQDEATPHLHIDFVPYVTNWKGKGMDTRVSLKQALKSLGFQGGNRHDTELNQWINHEKEVLAEIAKQHGIEWEQKGTHEEHLDVYNFKKKERKKEVQKLEQEKENLTAENEGLTSQIVDARADIKLLEEEKIQFQKDKETAEKRVEKAETELKKLEDRREFLQPVMDNVSKEIKEYGMIKTFLPEATALERAVTYREKKIKPLFIEMKNKIGAMAAQVKELTRERDSWKSKFQKKKQECENTKKELVEIQKGYQKLSSEKEILQGLADRYNRLLRMLGKDMVERLVQDDIRMQAELEAKKQKAQMPKKISDCIPWAKERSEEHNVQIKKNKAKYRGMEL